MAEKTDWIAWVKENIKEHPITTNKHGLWAQEYAFYRGDQYRYWDQTLGLLREVNVAREARCIYNACRPFVNLFVSKMLKDDPMPKFRPLPSNTEDEDINTVKVGNGMIEHWWKNCVFGSKILRHQVQWGAITGLGIGKIYYDKRKVSGNYVGEVEWATINPFYFRCNAGARRDEDMLWASDGFPQDKAFTEELFNLPKDSLKADEKAEIDEKRIAGGKRVDDYISAQSGKDNTVIVNDIWFKACRDYPNGKHVIVAGGKVLVDEDNTEPDMLPFFTFRVKPLPDELCGDGVLKDILVPQRDMNRVESIVQGNASFMGVGKWLVNRNSSVLQSAFKNEESERIDYDNDMPELKQGIPVPEQIAGRWWDILRKMRFITGFAESDSGDIPYRGSQTSPGVIKELKQSTAVIFAPDIAETSDYMQNIMRRWFFLAKKYYPEKRQVEILGDNRMPEVQWFNANKYLKSPDFTCDIGAGFSESQEARMDQMIQFATTGLFDKIQGFDWQSFGKQVMEYGGLNKLSEDTFLDQKQARVYLEQILLGNSVEVSQYANYPVHIKVFTDFTKKPEWMKLTTEQRASIDGYITEMNMRMQAQMMQQMMAQQPPPMMGPGNQKPQTDTATERAEAGANRRQATGQPVPNDMEQAQALQGV